MDSSTPQITGPPLRLLSLDGGGVCALSSLLILENIMENIQKSEDLSELPRPCDRFDFIGGTGTGGIIAIMLGRLKMSIARSIEEYKSLASEIFVPEPTPSSTIPTIAFSATRLEAAIKRMIRNNCADSKCLQRKNERHATGTDTCPHEDMLFAQQDCTKTAVLAMTKDNIETLPTLFKTYHVPGCFEGCKVWEVARATSAAITLFDPIKLGRDGIEFIDASYGYNNPCEALISEAKEQFPGRRIMILSIGTGLGDVVEISDSRDSVLEALEKMATTSKDTDLRLKQKYTSSGVYYRFNVENGLKNGQQLDGHKLNRISAYTLNYVNENKPSVKHFVTAFNMSDKKVIESRKGGLLKDSYQWILSHDSFQQFRSQSGSPILWIKGDPGKGKTMLLCGIIDQLTPDQSVSLSYFFCQATNDQLNTATSVLRGLIYHLAYHNPHLTKHVRESMLDDSSLRNAILIVDALDECRIDQKQLLEFITKPSRAKWIVSSRNWPDIEEILDDAEQKVKIHLEINQKSVSAAVDSFIDFKVDQLAQKKKYNREMKLAVLEHLRLNADGTFLWICDLDDAQLCKDIIANVLVTYRPVTLDELYVLVEALDDLEKDDPRTIS
ncbi:Vegetative incompatibility protein HET-E-1 [Ceratocystis platani]|uniref:Vegetative incompatibility protein HET-E-1 n=1 Tax=Ceratocystis fimbriata f. sp. platani TaxID=88771 RepID=A0A0F8B1D9_CERFI|nr:Vegetative incompatibility protein HET-E-1 [Ceratocystis platani]